MTMQHLLVALARNHGIELDVAEVTRVAGETFDRERVVRLMSRVGLTANWAFFSRAAIARDLTRLGPCLLVPAEGSPLVVLAVVGPPWRRALQVADARGVVTQLPADDAEVEVLALVPGRFFEGEHDHHHHHPSPWQRLLALLKPERADISVVAVYGALVALLSLSLPLAVSSLVNTIAFSNLLQPLIILSVILLIALLAVGGLRALQLYIVEMLQRRLFVRLVADLAWRLPRLSQQVREQQDISKLVNRFFDVLTAQKAIPVLLVDGVTLLLEVLVGIILLAVYSPLLLVFAGFLAISTAFIIFGLGIGGVKTSVAESYAKHDVAGWLDELVRYPTLFRDAPARSLAAAKADRAAREYIATRRQHFRILLRQAIASFALQAIASMSLLAVGGMLVVDGTLTLGQLVAAEIIVSTITYGLVKLHKQLESAFDLLAAVDKIGALVDLEVEHDVIDEKLRLPNGSVALELRDLTLDGVTAAPLTDTIEFGSAVIIDNVGGVGTAFVEALVGYRGISGGRLLIGGRDVAVLSDNYTSPSTTTTSPHPFEA